MDVCVILITLRRQRQRSCNRGTVLSLAPDPGDAVIGDRLSALDASFLHIEDSSAHMHVASVMLFEGPPPPYDELLEGIEDRLGLVPRYRQRLAYVPLGQGRPRWVDDPHLNLRYHVRVTALPSPGSEEQLMDLAGRVFSQQLDRDKPLWEIWLVEGLEDDRFALLAKTHHALVDGVSGIDIVSVLFDTSPEPAAPTAAGERWLPRPLPSSAAAARRGAARARHRAGRGRAQRARRVPRPAPRARRPEERRRGRGRDGLGGPQPRPASPVQRDDRPAPPLHLGARRAARHQGDQGLARRDRQRRGARHRRRRARPAPAPPRARDRRARAEGDDPGERARRGRARRSSATRSRR